jgi:2-polyprenyl-3-methyl-5-hydroxy-6-metoxy-1,4-benzoquinol methylase
MKAQFANHLRCPRYGDALTCMPYKSVGNDDVIDGLLKSPRGAAYVIQRGVPQLLCEPAPARTFIEAYEKRIIRDAPGLLSTLRRNEDFSFSYQWSLHSYDALTWELLIPERLALFSRYFRVSPGDAGGARLLDAGCGNGTLSAALAQQGLEVFALDYSTSVYRAFEKHLLDSAMTAEGLNRLHYLQADVQHPPFPDAYFDMIYSDGVLHHTPDTKASFMALARKVKVGGQFFIWLYRQDLKPGAKLKLGIVKIGRRALRRVSHDRKLALCYAGAAMLLARLRLLRMFGYTRRRPIPLRLKALNLFDTFSPQFNHEHTSSEVTAWFHEAGFGEVRDVSFPEYRFNEEGFALIGTRT